MNCPLCDGEIKSPKGITVKGSILITECGSVRLGWTMETVVRALIRGPASTETLVDLVYGGLDAAPNYPACSLQVGLCRLRPRLADLGWAILYQGAVYTLKKLERVAA